MSIQFKCAKCSNPVEVDDPLAGQLATCPFCHTVIQVPAASTLDLAQLPQARPMPLTDRADGAAARAPGVPADWPEHAARLAYQRAWAARTWAKYALVCAGLVLALVTAMLIIASVWIGPEVETELSHHATIAATSQASDGLAREHSAASTPRVPSQDDFARATQAVVMRSPALATVVSAIFLALALTTIIGTALAVVSLRLALTWQGVASLVVCGPLLLCGCGLAIASLAMAH